MLRISFLSLWARRRRLLATCVSVTLGVAFLAGTLVLGDTLRANFDRLFAETSAGTDVVVRSDVTVEDNPGPDALRALIDESLVQQIAAVDGVAAVEGQVSGYGSLLGTDGDAIGGNGPPRVAGSWVTVPELNPYRLVEGRAPESPTEVVVNRGAAKAGDLEVGDTTIVQAPGPIEVTIVGIATFGDADGLGETTFTAFTLEGAQANVTGRPGQVGSIVVAGEPGLSSNELRDRIDDVLPDGIESITGEQLTEERLDDLEFVDILRTFLVVFALIALVVATISINNTFTITVAQRTRELALLRAIGSTRRQVRWSVQMEAVIVGVVSAVVGVVAGFGIAGLLKGMFDAFGFALPAGGLTVRPTSLAIAGLVGIVVTMLAARAPARRASAVAPVAAMRGADDAAETMSTRRRISGVVLATGGLVAVAVGGLVGAIVVTGPGALALVVGTVLAMPVAVPLAASVLGGALRRLRAPEATLATQNARRNPRRTAATATALLVGITVVTMFTVFVASLQASIGGDVRSQVDSDLVVSTPVFGGGALSPELLDELDGLPQIDRTLGVGGGPALVEGEKSMVTATDPAGIDGMLRVDTVAGSFDDVGAGGAAVSESRSDSEGWRVGDTIEVTFVDGTVQQFVIESVYEDNQLLGGVVLPSGIWNEHTLQATYRSVFVDAADGVPAGELRAILEPYTDRYGGDVQDAGEFADATTAGLDMLLGIVYVMLALAIVIALLGIANTLSLAVHERRREIGLLRAVGQTQRQTRSTLRYESVIVSAFGTMIGLALGAVSGWALYAAVSDDPGGFSLPVVQVTMVAVIGALAGVLAALRPARRAAKLPILDAIAAP